jgi:hypothetical protein
MPKTPPDRTNALAAARDDASVDESELKKGERRRGGQDVKDQ